MNFEQFVKDVIANGGGSYNPNFGTTNPNKWYMVSLPQYERVVNEDQIRHALEEMLAKSVDLTYHDPDYYIGAWFNQEDGKWYVDISQNIHSLKLAIKLGMAWGQKAIYDCANDRVIDLPSAQTAGTGYQKQTFINQEVERISSEVKSKWNKIGG